MGPVSSKRFYLLFATTFFCGALFSGCRDRNIYHDRYYNDDHPRAAEEPYYHRWEQETHREHQDLNQRNQDEQKQYWDWRHHQR